MTGKLVLTRVAADYTETINLQELRAGEYLVQVTDNRKNKVNVIKISKSK